MAACYWDLMLCWRSQERDTKWELLKSVTFWNPLLSGKSFGLLIVSFLTIPIAKLKRFGFDSFHWLLHTLDWLMGQIKRLVDGSGSGSKI